ncbi:hypothetical protein ACFE04_002561 [Oxalis oulophora]
MTKRRPSIQVNTTYTGSVVVAETTTTMASSSLVFKKSNHDYSASYSLNIPQAQIYYSSSGYVDELLWAASRLYIATRDKSYLDNAAKLHRLEFANWGDPSWFSWDVKHAGVQVLASRLNFFDVKGIGNDKNLALRMVNLEVEVRVVETDINAPKMVRNEVAN